MTRIKAFAIVWTVVLAVALFGIDLTGQTGAAKDEWMETRGSGAGAVCCSSLIPDAAYNRVLSADTVRYLL